MVRRGEVWWVEDLHSGRRPHLALTRDAVAAKLNSIIAVPATTQVRGIPTEVALGTAEGLPRECVLSLDNVTQIPKELFVERICQLSPARVNEVCKALAIATGCR